MATSVLVVGCGAAGVDRATAPTAVPTNVRVQDPSDFVQELDQIFQPDDIPPIYDPIFAPAADVPYADQELILGISLEGEAKAYPITMLSRREIVNDHIGEVPILVTW